MDTRITTHKLSSLEKNLENQIIEILDQYYSSPKEMLNHLNTTNTHVYLLELDNKIIGFYMYGIQTHDDFTFLHLGQSCISREFAGSKIASTLYKYQLEDLKSMNLPSNSIIYATTANEKIFNYSFSIYNEVRPNRNGEYNSQDLEKLNSLLSKKKWESSEMHPYLIKKNSKIRFKEQKIRNNSESFFASLEIEEHEGDRLVLILKP